MKAHVIHIVTKMEMGGAQMNTLYTVEHLDRSRFSAALWSGDGGIMNDDARALADVEFRIVENLVREISPARDLKALFELRRMLAEEVRRSEVPVIVHTHSSKAGILGRLAAWMAGVPVIIHTFHGFGFNDYQSRPKRTAYIMAERITGLVTDFFVPVSRANLEKADRLKVAPASRSRVIIEAVDVKAFVRPEFDAAAKKKSIGLEPDKPLVLMVACFKPQKSPVDFVRVAARVARDFPDARFATAGDGELRPEVEAAVAEEGLGDKFRVLGWRRDVPELVWSTDVLVLTSLWEGLPRVYPQAMAAGVPIVGTRVDGGPEAVEDGVNGWLLDPGDIEGMARRVVELLCDPSKAKAMGEAGKERADKFDVDLMVREHEALYEDLLAEIVEWPR